MAEPTHEKQVHGIVAEYSSVDSLLAACRRVRDAGYTKTDAFTPFPVHGIDTALGIRPTSLPWIALAGGLAGTALAFGMQIWMNGIDYQYIISGKPFISTPAFVPVAFELTILLASFGAFFGMWALNGLPRFSNPIFTSSRFDRATDDAFFLYIDAKDGRYDRAGVERLLSDTGGEHIEAVVDDETPAEIPRFLLIGLVAIIGFSLIPLLIVAKMRVSKSGSPRFHVFYDMDLSPSKDAQQTTTLFTDFRSARPDVPGTVTWKEKSWDLNYQSGIDVDALSSIDKQRAERLVATYLNPQDPQPADAAEGGEESAEQNAASGDGATEGSEQPEADNTPWLQENPLELSRAVFETGREKFEIYCAVCHGVNGRGNGLVNQRAQRILAQTWTPPSNIIDPTLYKENYADGKLFSTITNGIRKMPGYGSQIETEDRWAIVAYVRALQLSQDASLDMVPESQREAIAEQQAEVERQLAAAEEEAQQQADEEAEDGSDN